MRIFPRLILTLNILLFILPGTVTAKADKQFGGIGAQVVPTSTGEIVVLQLVAGSPAQLHGLLPGDLIVKIGDVSLKGLDFKTVTRDHLWGFVGKSVQISWLRPGETIERSASLVRVKIDQKSLRHPDVKMVIPKL